MLRKSTSSFLFLIGLLLGNIPAVSFAFELRVIDWVQGRPGIPHPAVNGKRTMLQAIIEAPECPDSAYFRWDINADGDFDDNVNGQTENWRHASKNSGTYYFNLATIDVQLPDARGDFTTSPRH